MYYPKPLSEKSLDKLYKESGLTTEQTDFLHKLFCAAANLYGVIPLAHLWEVYKDLSEKADVPKVKRKDMIAFSGIARREVQPYYVSEIDELYTEEKRKDLDRQIILRSLIRSGGGGLVVFYDLVEKQFEKPYYVPEDLLDFAEIKETEENRKLRTFLGNLRVTEKEVTDAFGKVTKCRHTGKKLKNFSYFNKYEQFEVDYYGGKTAGHKRNEKLLREHLERYRGTEAEKLTRKIQFKVTTGSDSPTYVIKSLVEELQEVGVVLDIKLVEELTKVIYEYNNNSQLMQNRGWKPVELRAAMPPGDGPKIIKMGPGLKQLIKDGEIDLDEYRRMVEAHGFKLEE